MWRGKIVTVILGAFVAVSVMTGIAAAEDFKQYGVRMRALAVLPDTSGDSTLTGMGVNATTAEAPELDLEYFFTRNFSTEVILGVVKTDLHANGTSAPIGATWLLPPTLTLKYHPFPTAKISPYVGFGVNTIIPFRTRVANLPATIKPSIGWAAQAGIDVPIVNNLYFNFDFKYLNADTRIDLAGTDHDLDLNPYVFGIGVGYRF
jgi:outer membrane protein